MQGVTYTVANSQNKKEKLTLLASAGGTLTCRNSVGCSLARRQRVRTSALLVLHFASCLRAPGLQER